MNERDTSRRVDEELLRYLSQVFGRLQTVDQTSLFPSNRKECLVIALDTKYYPPAIDSVRLEIRVYTNGDFHISYFETYLGEQRRCRWDRHPQTHNTRDHFHPFPTASTSAAEDREFSADVTDVVQRAVLPRVDRRLGELWEKEQE